MTEAERRLIRESVVRDLRAFRGLALAALRASGPAVSSGLVEQQAWFQRLRGRSVP